MATRLFPTFLLGLVHGNVLDECCKTPAITPARASCQNLRPNPTGWRRTLQQGRQGRQDAGTCTACRRTGARSRRSGARSIGRRRAPCRSMALRCSPGQTLATTYHQTGDSLNKSSRPASALQDTLNNSRGWARPGSGSRRRRHWPSSGAIDGQCQRPDAPDPGMRPPRGLVQSVLYTPLPFPAPAPT